MKFVLTTIALINVIVCRKLEISEKIYGKLDLFQPLLETKLRLANGL